MYSHKKPVRPNKVSLGERNIIALCYFFTEILENQQAKDGYSNKLIIVIDDPVSSFDFENRIGIMSLLKTKISDIVKSNYESQVLLMTHDIKCLYDLQKIGNEVSSEYKKKFSNQKKLTFSCLELKNIVLTLFNVIKRNEYSEIFKIVYDYACNENNNDNDDLVI